MSPSRSGAGAQTVLITGASSGIGAAAARRLAAAGYRVFGTSRHPRPDHSGIHMIQMDVRSDESVAHAVGEVVEQAGGLDILVNNAGIMLEAFAEETGRSAADAVFETNFFGVIRVTNMILPQMRERRRGRIINVGSLAAWIGEPGEGIYAASKAALARYTEALRHEVWHLGIHVSLLELGAFTTGVLDAASDQGLAGVRIPDYDGPREAAHRTLHDSLRHGGDPQKVAKIITAIARARRPRARYVAGREAHWVPLATTLFPQRLTDHMLRRAYRLPGSGQARARNPSPPRL